MPRARSYREVILADNPFAYLRLGDGPTTFADEVGGHYGQNTSSASDLTARKPGVLPNDPTSSVLFGGGNTAPPTVITLTNTSSWDPTTLTCECWVYPTAAQTSELWNKEISQNQNWRARIDAGNTVSVFVLGGAHIMTSTGTVKQNAWNHVVIYLSGATGGGNAGIYINGKLDKTATNIGMGPGQAAPIGIGQSSSEEMKGYMQECAFYLYILTPGQVAEHFRARIAPAARTLYGSFAALAAALPLESLSVNQAVKRASYY